MVDQGDAGVDRIELAEDGSISEWPDYFIADPDEEPDWDTPRVPVMWLGLREALSHTDEPQTRRED